MQEQTEKQNIKISVRNLVEFILRSGDIDNRKSRVMQAEAMQEGSLSLIHISEPTRPY